MRAGSGDQREDTARAAGRRLGALWAGAAEAILSALRDAVRDAAVAAGPTVVSRRLRRRLARLLEDAHRASVRVLGALRIFTAPGPGEVAELLAGLTGKLDAARSQAEHTTAVAFGRIVRQTLTGGVLGEAERLAAAQQILDALADQGITVYTDAAGRRWDLASYVEMATRTAAARALVHRQLAAYTSQGHDTVVVAPGPAGRAPCPRCRPYVGQVLSITRPVGAGTLAEAIAGGLLHPNCRHSLIPAGAAPLPASAPPSRGVYEAEQRQRALERRVRAWRRRLAAALTPQAQATARRRLAAAQRASREHAVAHGLTRQPRRERADVAR